MLHLKFYKYTDKPIIVNKTSYLGTSWDITGEVPEANQDMERPTVFISSSTEFSYNYAYIQEYHRYYYLDKKVWVSGNVWAISLVVDELYTYKALVSDISGIVEYSAYGDGNRYDGRLVYNEPIKLSDGVPASTWKKPGTIYILMPTMFFASLSGMEISNNMRYYVFPLSSFYKFVRAYNKVANSDDAGTLGRYEKLAIAIGKCIQGCYLLRWFDVTGFTPITAGAIRFDSPEINQICTPLLGQTGTGGYELDLRESPSDVVPYYIFYHETLVNSVTLSWLITTDSYWLRKARRTVHIPYIGNVSIDIDNLGAGAEYSMFLGVEIKYDFSSNAYVVTPGWSPITGSLDTITHKYPLASQRFPNQYTTPFVVDVSFSHTNEIIVRQIMSTMGSLVSTYMGIQAELPMAISQGAMSSFSSGVNLFLSKEQTRYAQASSMIAQGTANGGSPDNVYLTEDDNYNLVYPSAFLETQLVEPSNDYSSFWADHGLPDGAYRSLGSLSGFIKMREFEMIYDSNATKGEMDRLEAMLYKGVIL